MIETIAYLGLGALLWHWLIGGITLTGIYFNNGRQCKHWAAEICFALLVIHCIPWVMVAIYWMDNEQGKNWFDKMKEI